MTQTHKWDEVTTIADLGTELVPVRAVVAGPEDMQAYLNGSNMPEAFDQTLEELTQEIPKCKADYGYMVIRIQKL